MALSTLDCCELKLARYDPMENAASGVWAAMDDLSVVTVEPAWPFSTLNPPQKIWGTAWPAVTWTALQGWVDGGEVAAQSPALRASRCRSARVPGSRCSVALDPLSVSTLPRIPSR